jgi:hypothetical protein
MSAVVLVAATELVALAATELLDADGAAVPPPGVVDAPGPLGTPGSAGVDAVVVDAAPLAGAGLVVLASPAIVVVVVVEVDEVELVWTGAVSRVGTGSPTAVSSPPEHDAAVITKAAITLAIAGRNGERQARGRRRGIGGGPSEGSTRHRRQPVPPPARGHPPRALRPTIIR